MSVDYVCIMVLELDGGGSRKKSFFSGPATKRLGGMGLATKKKEPNAEHVAHVGYMSFFFSF